MSNSNNEFVPRPPNYPPRVDVQLEIDLIEAERKIKLYESEIALVREQLNMKQDELVDEQNQFRQVKNNLMAKITEFTNLLAQRDEELAEVTEKQQLAKVEAERREQLEKQVESLKTELQLKVEALEKELQL